MATLTAKLSLTSSNVTSDALSMSITDILTITKDVEIKRIATSDTSTKFFDNTAYTKAFIFLKNTDTTNAITIEGASGSNVFFVLEGGEFAFFPWNSSNDLFADAATSTTPVLEVMIFEV